MRSSPHSYNRKSDGSKEADQQVPPLHNRANLIILAHGRRRTLIKLSLLSITLGSALSAQVLALEPLCYAQIGGLTAAAFITLLLVPIIYTICVLDLKIVKWDVAHDGGSGQKAPGGIPETVR